MIEFTVAGRIGRIVIRRPDAGNAFTRSMVERLVAAIGGAADACDILVISGEGADFSLGRDRAEPKAGTPFEGFLQVGRSNHALASFPGISLAVVRGRAFGFGVGLTMRCDLAIASDDARFCLDEVRLGFPPMFIMEEILQHLPPKRAADVVFLSGEFGAETAREMGLLSRVVPAQELETVAEEMVAELGARNADVLRACKHYMRTVRDLPAEARPSYALLAQTRFAMESH